MKKYTLLIILLLSSVTLIACANYETKKEYAVGKIDKTQLLQDYHSFFNSYQNFELAPLNTKQVEHWPENLRIEVYFGTWCHDSQREVPHLLKELANNEKVEIMLFALDINKSDPSGTAEIMQVKYTPTFVVYLAGKEIGRIIERPKLSLVEDISLMIKEMS